MSSSDDQDSPVTRYILLWVLLTLAISLMIQPTGRWCGLPIPRRYRVYICISPILCLADALSIICSSIITWYMFDISTLNAIRFVDYWRSRRDDECEQSDHIERPDPRSGPRWVIFIIGTLPALIKLLSFSGVPWSTLWGLMFSLSYFLIESVNMVASHASREFPDSMPKALGFSVARWDMDVNSEVRHRADLLETLLKLTNRSIQALATITQAILISWALSDFRSVTRASNIWDTAGIRTALEYVSAWLTCCPFALMTMCILTRAINTWGRIVPRVSWSNIETPFFTMMFVNGTILTFVPISKSAFRRDPWTYDTTVGLSIAGPWYVISGVLTWLCTRVPRIGKTLLIMTPSSPVDDIAHVNDRTEWQVDSSGLNHVGFFIIHLFLGITWYVTRYDSAGTTNPTWTGVFG